MKLFLIILAMSIVTFVPRLIPALIMDKLKFPGRINSILKTIPYAALGALIFPSILTVVPDLPVIGLIGGLIALVLAYMDKQIIYIVFTSIVAVICLKLFLI